APMAAATATRMTTVPMPLVRREVPAAGDVSRTDPPRGRDVRALAVSCGGKAAVVLVGLELVLHRRVVEKPEEVLRVTGRNQDRQAARQCAGGRARPSTARRGPDPQHVHISEHGANHGGAGVLTEGLSVDRGQHRDAVPGLDVAADAHLLAGRDRDRDPALGYRKERHVAGAEEVARRGYQLGGGRAVARNVAPGAFACDVPDVGERLRRSRADALEREV